MQACRTDRRAPRYQTRSNERARSVNPPPPPKTSRARARWFCPQALASVMPAAHSLSGPSAAHCLLWAASLCSEKNRVRDRVSLAADSRCPRASCNRPPQCRRTPRRPAAVRALCSGGRQTWPLWRGRRNEQRSLSCTSRVFALARVLTSAKVRTFSTRTYANLRTRHPSRHFLFFSCKRKRGRAEGPGGRIQ